jgi:hypothetical protein
MPLGARIAPSVVCHPPGHLSQGRCRSEQRRIAGSSVGAEEPGRHVGLKVPDHTGIQVAAASLKIGCPERSHRHRVRIMDLLFGSRKAAGELCRHGRC